MENVPRDIHERILIIDELPNALRILSNKVLYVHPRRVLRPVSRCRDTIREVPGFGERGAQSIPCSSSYPDARRLPAQPERVPPLFSARYKWLACWNPRASPL